MTARLLRRLSEESAPAKRQQIRDEVVVVNMPVAASIARRYRGRGAEFDDVLQVAHLALVAATQRFDPATGTDFLAFAVPTMRGEIKRFFRDQCWAMRPTRRIQETRQAIASCEPRLSQQLGRSPTPSELAEALRLDEEHVIEALASEGCFHLTSIDKVSGWDSTAASVADRLGSDDWQLAWVENHQVVAPVLNALDDHDKLLLRLRFERGWTQTQIAAEFGISQMQVSRQLSGLLARLREALAEIGASADTLAPSAR